MSHGGSDEHDGRTEQVLATATSRSRAFLATASSRSAGATWLLLVAGVTLALGVGNDTDHSFGRLVASALAQAPAMWVVVALAVLVLRGAQPVGACWAGAWWCCSPRSARSASCSTCRSGCSTSRPTATPRGCRWPTSSSAPPSCSP